MERGSGPLNKGKQETIDYYKALVGALRGGDERSKRIVDELRRTVKVMHELARVPPRSANQSPNQLERSRRPNEADHQLARRAGRMASRDLRHEALIAVMNRLDCLPR